MRIAPIDLPPGTEQAFLRLQTLFVEGLPGRWAAICAAPDSVQRQALLHRLKGAAGTYGFVILSRAARCAEEAELLADPATLAAALHDVSEEIEALVRTEGAPVPPVTTEAAPP